MGPHLAEPPAHTVRTLGWLLRGTVCVQCVGHWRWLVQIGETPLLSWLIEPHDVGGLAWSEPTALVVQQAAGWLILAAGLALVVRPSVAVAGFLTLVQMLIATAMWRTGSGFLPDAGVIAPQLSSLFPFTSQAARIAAPLGLVLLGRWPSNDTGADSPAKIRWAMGVLRVGIVVTFLAHGWEAWQHYPVFIDLLIRSCDQLGLPPMRQSVAERLLTGIGVMDFTVALLCIATRWRWVLVWMMAWGAITAVSRTVADGWEWGLHASLARAAHVGIPAVLARYQHLLQSRVYKSSLPEHASAEPTP